MSCYRTRKPDLVQLKGYSLVRRAEEETGTSPRAAWNQADCEPDVAGGSVRTPIKIKTAL